MIIVVLLNEFKSNKLIFVVRITESSFIELMHEFKWIIVALLNELMILNQI